MNAVALVRDNPHVGAIPRSCCKYPPIRLSNSLTGPHVYLTLGSPLSAAPFIMVSFSEHLYSESCT